MNSTDKRRLLYGVLGVAGLAFLVTICLGGVFSDDEDPTGYLRDHYQRDASLDKSDGGAAYTSTTSRAAVVSDLKDDTEELNHRSAEGADFLQYGDHIVAVSDRSNGSLIYLDDYRDGYRRYSGIYPAFVGFGWSSSPPGSGFFGGGGGFGK